MKKLLLLLSLTLFSVTIKAQEIKTKNINPYLSLGLSITNNNDFLTSSYPSLEFGLSGNYISGSLVFGRGSLKGIAEKTDVINNYFYELKTSYSIPVNDKIIAYPLLGIGQYINTKHSFIEYGAGFNYMFNDKVYYFAQASNWDNLWYVSQGLTFNF